MYQLNASSSFAERTKYVFDTLGVIEMSHNTKAAEYVARTDLNQPDDSSPDDTTMEPVGQITEKLKDLIKERRDDRIFYKVPKPVKRHSEKKPDFKKNPEKWKKYDLRDVKDLGDRGNFAAAMSFLNEKNRIMEVDEKEEEEVIVFNRPLRKKVLPDCVEEEVDEDVVQEVGEADDAEKGSKGRRAIRRSLRKVVAADEAEEAEVHVVCLRKSVAGKRGGVKSRRQVIEEDFEEMDLPDDDSELEDI